ncbi:hypothetical protein HN014_18445 [Aquimarina sp. TRL1]|uniref:hypothetical protein n=1 Tax=Aquimarina sp. (strain TRL1) TaxID=2736252 RepID=UPI00158E2541|nr:hypothetical protein [Aquimarina sp. TRL1]QKX06810.1 hypothetical protein HN014_18445 [Aquimarina sp. TRL1]
MISDLPISISLFFGVTTLLTFLLFIWVIRRASQEGIRKKAIPIAIGLLFWLLLQAVLMLQGIYNTDRESFPPNIMLYGLFPAILGILLLFVTPRGRWFADNLPLKNITYLHLVRIPVELILYGLFIYGTIPELMTFEGRNFDILAGFTAPFIAYYGVHKNKLPRSLIVIWNLICLALLINIVINALLSAPFPLQQFAFEQPNIAVLNFPFSWLPTFIVPVVLLMHLIALRQLLLQKKNFSDKTAP